MSLQERVSKELDNWWNKHKDSDRVIFDTVSHLPIKAEYDFSLGSFIHNRIKETMMLENEGKKQEEVEEKEEKVEGATGQDGTDTGTKPPPPDQPPH